MLAFLSGALLKIYDDFVDDEPYITNEHIATILRYLQIVCVVLVTHSDFWVSLMFTLFNGLCAFSSSEEYSGPHVVAYFAIMPIMLMTSWGKWTSISMYDVATFIIFLGVAILEPRVTPEETSWFKCVVRFGGAYNCFMTLFIYSTLFNPSVITMYKMMMGYCIASAAGQFLKLTWLNPSQYEAERAVLQVLEQIRPSNAEHRAYP